MQNIGLASQEHTNVNTIVYHDSCRKENIIIQSNRKQLYLLKKFSKQNHALKICLQNLPEIECY